jgi:hypothetical protein
MTNCGSIIATSGNSCGSESGYLILSWVSEITMNEVTSEPVPDVVGIAISLAFPEGAEIVPRVFLGSKTFVLMHES